MGTASCQVHVGGSRADALISLHLCFVKGGKVESPSGMKGAPNDIAEIALPRSTVVRRSVVHLPLARAAASAVQRPTSRQSEAEPQRGREPGWLFTY